MDVWPVGGLKAGFEAELERQGYSPATASGYLRRFAKLNCWMARARAGAGGFLAGSGGAVLCGVPRCGLSRITRASGATSRCWRSCGRRGCRVEEPVSPGPVDVLLDRFAGWLSRERHLAPSSVETYVWHVAADGGAADGGDRVELSRLDAAFVRRFVVDTCPRQGRASAKVTVVAVRQLLGFLYLDGGSSGRWRLRCHRSRAVGYRDSEADRAVRGAADPGRVR